MKKSLILIFLLIAFCCKEAEVTPPAPQITAYNRALSVIGKELVITGSNFSTVPEENVVTFAGEVNGEVTGSTTTEVRVFIPTGAVTGPIKVTVKGQTAIGPVFTIYVAGVVNSISPVSGPEGTVVKIYGTGFETNTVNTSVLFRGEGNLLVPTPVVDATPTQLTVGVPAGARTGEIYLAAYGSETLKLEPQNSTMFTIAEFTLADYSPKSAKQLTSVTLTGSGFSTVLANISVNFTGFGGTRVPGNVTSLSDTQIVVTIPNDATTGPISLKVKNSGYVFFNNPLTVIF